jgi:hypothetical protein
VHGWVTTIRQQIEGALIENLPTSPILEMREAASTYFVPSTGIYIFMYIYIYIYVYIYIFIYIYIHVYVYINIYINIYMQKQSPS